jgi:hypothetical protein
MLLTSINEANQGRGYAMFISQVISTTQYPPPEEMSLTSTESTLPSNQYTGLPRSPREERAKYKISVRK